MEPGEAVRFFQQACGEITAFAAGWNKRRLVLRTYEIFIFVLFNSEQVISLDRRRRINRLAADILLEEEGAPPEFWNEMADLAGREPDWRVVPPARRATKLLSELDGLSGLTPEFLKILRTRAAYEQQRFATSRDWGGDRRSGEHSLWSSVLRMAIRLYCEAHASPGASRGGPLFRFANAIGELILEEPRPFTPDAVRGEFRRMTPTLMRIRSLRAWQRYSKTTLLPASEPAPKAEPDKS